MQPTPDRPSGVGPRRPSFVIKDMYLEINHIAQGINIGLFALVLTTPGFYAAIPLNFYSTPFFALASLVISIIFWMRYHLDTEVLDRSYTVLSASWFFAYVVSQGIAISLVTRPATWLLSTGVFLFFGAGCYALNLLELRRKQAARALPVRTEFEDWQWRRLIELLVLSGTSLAGAWVVSRLPGSALLAALFSLSMAIWQLVLTNDYRRLKFIEAGV